MFHGESRMRACVCVCEKKREACYRQSIKKTNKVFTIYDFAGFFFNLPFLIGGPVKKIIKRHVVTVSLNGQ